MLKGGGETFLHDETVQKEKSSNDSEYCFTMWNINTGGYLGSTVVQSIALWPHSKKVLDHRRQRKAENTYLRVAESCEFLAFFLKKKIQIVLTVNLSIC